MVAEEGMGEGMGADGEYGQVLGKWVLVGREVTLGVGVIYGCLSEPGGKVCEGVARRKGSKVAQDCRTTCCK